MIPASDPCFRCGACCAMPAPWGRVHLSKQDKARIPLHLTENGMMRKEGNRCVALVGTVGVDAHCGIHDIKPSGCIEFDPLNETRKCEECKLQAGLSCD